MVGDQLAAEPLRHRALEGHRDRISVMAVEVGLVLPLYVVSVYLWAGEGLSERNCRLLGALVELLLSLKGLWVAGGDFNMEPEALADSGFLDAIRGTLAAPEETTCSASAAGTVFDYFLLPEVLESSFSSVFLAKGAPSSPHTPVCLTLKGLEATATITKVIRPKSFPAERPIGCMQAPKSLQWSWATGEPPAKSFKQSFAEWTTAAETELCRVYQISGDQARKHLGRAKGFATKQVKLLTQFRQDSREFLSTEGHAWAGLAALVGRARCAKQDLARSHGDRGKARTLHVLANAVFSFTGACSSDSQGNRLLQFTVRENLLEAALAGGARQRTPTPPPPPAPAPAGERTVSAPAPAPAPANLNQQQEQQHSSSYVFVDSAFSTACNCYPASSATYTAATSSLSYLRGNASEGDSNNQQSGNSHTQPDLADFTSEPGNGRQQQAASRERPTNSSSSKQPPNSSSQPLDDFANFTRVTRGSGQQQAASSAQPTSSSHHVSPVAAGSSSSSDQQANRSNPNSIQDDDFADFTREPRGGGQQQAASSRQPADSSSQFPPTDSRRQQQQGGARQQEQHQHQSVRRLRFLYKGAGRRQTAAGGQQQPAGRQQQPGFGDSSRQQQQQAEQQQQQQCQSVNRPLF